MGMNLMKHVPNTMQKIPNYEHKRYSDPQKAEDGEHNHASGFESPRFLIPEIGSKGEIKSRDCDEEQTKEDLLYLRRE
jgi:hypothetical protein